MAPFVLPVLLVLEDEMVSCVTAVLVYPVDCFGSLSTHADLFVVTFTPETGPDMMSRSTLIRVLWAGIRNADDVIL